MQLSELIDMRTEAEQVGETIPCRDYDAELWFAERPEDVEFAKTLCGLCPARMQCLAGALERQEPWGVWGGQLLLNGKVLQSKRRRGRPPKVARPEDQLPEIPVPEHLRERIVYKSA